MKPSTLDFIGGVLDVASGLKSLGKAGVVFVEALKAASASSRLARAAKGAEALLDGASAVKTMATGRSDAAGEPQGALVAGLATIEQHAETIARGLADLQQAHFAQAVVHVVDYGGQRTNALKLAATELMSLPAEHPSAAALRTRLTRAFEDQAALGGTLETRMTVFKALDRARQRGAGPELTKGSAARGVFERVVSDKALQKRGRLVIVPYLEVDHEDKERHASDYYLDAGDPAQNSVLVADTGRLGIDAIEKGTRRPVSRAVYVAEPLGQGLEVIDGLPKIRLPLIEVRVTGTQTKVLTSISAYRRDPFSFLQQANGEDGIKDTSR